MMSRFQFFETKLPDLTIIQMQHSADQRGSFTKAFESESFVKYGIHFQLAEELETCSARNTLRGLHFQHRHSQDKLVRVLSGEIFDVAVDLRPESKCFGMWQSFYLSARERRMLYIPKGFAHGFLAFEENTVIHYLCGDRYDPDGEDGILWNDPELKIPWPLMRDARPLMSQRDQCFQTFAHFRESLIQGGTRFG